MVGVVEPGAQLRLARMIYRISRGYAVTKSLDEFKFKGLRYFEDKVMLILYPTTDSAILENKLQKAMETFCKSCYKMSDLEANIRESMQTIQNQYNEIIGYLEMNNKEYRSFLEKIKELNHI